MTTFNTSKEQNQSLSDTQTVQLHTKFTRNYDLDDLNYNKSKNGRTPDYLCFSFDGESNACLQTNLPTYNMKDTVDASSSQCTGLNFCMLEKEDISEKPKQYKSYDIVNNSSMESLKSSHKIVRKKEISCEAHSKISSNPFTGQVLSKAQSDNLLEENSSDTVKESAMPRIFSKQLVPSGKTLSGKSTDNNQPNQIKIKLRSMWNNMKYGWRVRRECNLKADSAAWLLGRCYHNKLNDGSVLSQDVSKQLKLDLLSKIFLTYRTNFPVIPGTEFVSDSGWGCMLRCGQMMMAQALVCHFLHRDWRISSYQPEETKQLYKMILRWFGDSLSGASPFSLHHLVSLGENYGRKPGDWYGPTHAAQVLRDALFLSHKEHPQLKDICMYVALDGIVFKQDIMDLCVKTSLNIECSDEDQSALPVASEFSPKCYSSEVPNSFQEKTFTLNSSIWPPVVSEEPGYNFNDTCPSYSEFGPPSFNTAQEYWRSLILFVSVRLGNDKVNPFYIPCLKSLLAYEHCIGIIGGRPKHALYFIGWQDDKLIHMDPHSCQPAVDMEKEDFNEKTFHSSSIRTISFSEMDPSCAIGFYFRLQEEFQHFVEKFSEIIAPMKKNLDYPVFALAEGRRIDVEEVDSNNTHAHSSFSNISNESYKEDDDYILL